MTKLVEEDNLIKTILQDDVLNGMFYAYDYLSQKEPISTILDYGCGYGWGSAYLADKGYEVVGYDIDEERINYAKNQYGNISHVKFTNQLDDAKMYRFDIIMFSHILKEEQDLEKIAKEVTSLKLSNQANIYIACKERYVSLANQLVQCLQKYIGVSRVIEVDKAIDQYGKIVLKVLSCGDNSYV